MRGSKIEVALRRELHRRGLRFYVDYGKAPGRPDLAFPSRRLAVFVDGELWHGLHDRIPDAIRQKVDASRRRDVTVNEQLKRDGWTVLRFPSERVRRNLDECVEEVTRAASL